MKKLYLGAVVGASALLLLTGCGSGNKVNCTASFEEGGHKYTGELIADLDNDDKVKDLSASMTFETEEDADQFYSMYESLINMAKQYAEEGQEVPEINIKKDGKKVIISDYAALEEMGSDEDGEKLIGMSKDDFIKKIESDESDGTKWTCK